MLWYALEHLDQTVMLRLRGVTDAGSGAGAPHWDADMLADPQVIAALGALDGCITDLSDIDRIDRPTIEWMRQSLSVLDPSKSPGDPEDRTRRS